MKLKQSNVASSTLEHKGEKESSSWAPTTTIVDSNLDRKRACIFTSHVPDIDFAHDWIIDSSCLNHLISYREIFNSLHDYIGFDATATVDDSLHLVKSVGDLSLISSNSSISLNIVYYVPA